MRNTTTAPRATVSHRRRPAATVPRSVPPAAAGGVGTADQETPRRWARVSAGAARRRSAKRGEGKGATTTVEIIDSHTAGEPTRVVLAGGPDLGPGGPAAGAAALRRDFDWFRAAVVEEPRGSEVLVGALLCPPTDPACLTGVIFFNNVSTLGMCGHGTMGVVASLAYLGRIGPGMHRLETPVGVVTAELHADGRVSVDNVRSFRHRAAVPVAVPGGGTVTGDIAWGGNWFFLVDVPRADLARERIPQLSRWAQGVREALAQQGITGAGGAAIDHIELSCPPDGDGPSRNFVLCPGNAYDRSPCGTGTSAKLACLAAAGRLGPGEPWVQEGIIGTRFEASYHPSPAGGVSPRITGRAFVTLVGRLAFDPEDPFRHGLPRSGPP
jgi:4-hydroxyproline epimerase